VRPRRVARLQRVDLGRDSAVELLRESNRSLQLLHCGPQLGPAGVDFDAVAREVVARGVDLLHGRRKLRSRALESAQVAAQSAADRNNAEDLVRRKEIALIAGVELVQVTPQRRDRLDRGSVLDPAQGVRHEPAVEQGRGHRDFLAPEVKRGIELGLEGVALHVLVQEALDEAVDLVVDAVREVGGERCWIRWGRCTVGVVHG
jgi:hypothetical protein